MNHTRIRHPESDSREVFARWLNENPPLRHRFWPTYLARCANQGRHSRCAAFGGWYRDNYRDEFEADYRKFVCDRNRPQRPALPDAKNGAKVNPCPI